MPYRPRLEALEDRSLLSATPTLAWTPNDAQFPSQPALPTIDAPKAWGTTVTARVPVAVVDTGIDYTHPDLYLNVWLNPGEIPAAVRARLLDADGDGRITFRDLNDARNQGTGKITDRNGNGFIDGADVLRPIALGGWADGVSNNGDGYVDDLVGWNFVRNTNDPYDDHGHGTHISGIIGAVGNNGVGVAGVAWNAQLMALKTFDARGIGDSRWSVAAVDYAANLGAKVVNASWVIGGSSPSLAAAIDRARLKNVVVVAAAGNSGANIDVTAAYPANSPAANVITVGAVDAAGNLAKYSNYGAKNVDLTAPGSNILSTNPGKSYGYRTGTSMATPFVSGALALVWGLRPEWTYRQVIDQVLNTVDRLPALSGKVASGGRLNLAAAVNVPPRGTAPARARVAEVTVILPVDAFFTSRRGRRWLTRGWAIE
jgi:serine protease